MELNQVRITSHLVSNSRLREALLLVWHVTSIVWPRKGHSSPCITCNNWNQGKKKTRTYYRIAHLGCLTIIEKNTSVEIFVHKHKPVKFNIGENGVLKVHVPVYPNQLSRLKRVEKLHPLQSQPIFSKVFQTVWHKLFNNWFSSQAPVVQKVDSSIHRINLYPADSAISVSLILIHWIEIYLMDSAIQLLNYWGQNFCLSHLNGKYS